MTVRLLAVCTHNRTRSVVMGALLVDHLARRGVVAVGDTAGMRDAGKPPTDETVRLLAARGFDVSGHRSSGLTSSAIEQAEIIVTAERQHVMLIAGRWRDTFVRTFTLPELVMRGESVGPRRGRDVDDWLKELNAMRPTGADYLSAPDVLDVVDPTGQAPSVWRSSIAEIDDLTGRVAALIA